ncbi:DUF956 family protein [Lactococcus termiticola]|uniref:Regulator of the mannose operon, ManO n=1 Tax=Lactococcus termiticola TaxID=2169526 RepID=A0A2R5HHC7_9LACT|nr:DUF956 family protein [Lactococcus termiticola]GBG97414.1 hypothetical protein NtB2_01559 [Lactococcus termiticola]
MSNLLKEAKGQIYLGTVENGIIHLTDEGLTFSYKNKRLGSDISLLWADVLQVEIKLSATKKIGKQFSITTEKSFLKFSSDEAPQLLKIIGQQVGTQKFTKAKSLLNVFTNPFKS